MILLKNRQRRFLIDHEATKELVMKILAIVDYRDFDIGIWLTTNRTIAHYNKLYRKKTGPTDILSFPFHTTLKPGERIHGGGVDEKNLGDIIISVEYIFTAKRWEAVTMQNRLPILLVHGICHLLGYDHETDQDYEVMRKQEESILKHIGVRLISE